jgi:hypothetical protein
VSWVSSNSFRLRAGMIGVSRFAIDCAVKTGQSSNRAISPCSRIIGFSPVDRWRSDAFCSTMRRKSALIVGSPAVSFAEGGGVTWVAEPALPPRAAGAWAAGASGSGVSCVGSSPPATPSGAWRKSAPVWPPQSRTSAWTAASPGGV